MAIVLSRRNLQRLLYSAALLFPALLGCGGGGDLPELAEVTGTVQMDGKPLPDATVMFVPADGRPSSATTDSNGNYTLQYNERASGAVPGKSRVMISTGKPGKENEDGESEPGTPETVPMEYNIDTNLTFEVKPGTSNKADFTLTGSGPLAAAAKGEEDTPSTSRERRESGE